MNFLTSFVRSLPHRSLIEIFSDRYIVTSASGKYFDNGLPQSTRYSVYLSSLSLISWAQKKMWRWLLRCEPDATCYIRLSSNTQDVRFYWSAEANSQRHNQLVLLAGNRHSTQLVQVTMRFALARWRVIKQLSQAYDCCEYDALNFNTFIAPCSVRIVVAFLWGKAHSWPLTAVLWWG
jgi:hypothetical protein